MRISIEFDDRLTQRVRREAAKQGKSVGVFIAAILDDALQRAEAHSLPPFRLVTVSGEGTYRDVDLDRPRSLPT